jgi:hypothetical protein
MVLTHVDRGTVMETYKIADIVLKIEYHYDDFLGHNIENYRCDDQKVDHTMSVHLVDHIEKPEGSSRSTKNPYILYEENKRIIFIKNHEGQIKSKVEHDKHYHQVNIWINPKLTTNAAEIEYTWLGLFFMEIALTYQKLSMHAAAIDYQGNGILIAAPSQTGKSTHAKFWQEMDMSVNIINDDKPLIGFHDGELTIYSSPFSGKTSTNMNRTLPLKAIVFLYQGKTNEITKLDKDEIILEMMKNMLRPSDEKSWDDMIQIMNSMITSIPFYRFYATKSIDAAKYLKEKLELGD